jgi:hypothetical protein
MLGLFRSRDDGCASITPEVGKDSYTDASSSD